MNSIIDFIIGSLDPLNIVRLILFLGLGLLLGVLLRPRPGNRVLKIFPDDKRFTWFDIIKEYAFSVETKKKRGYPDQRFIKAKSGFSGFVGGFLKKAQTIFFGVTGTAYTQQINSDPIKMKVADFLKGLWGPKFYKEIPTKQRDEVEKDEVEVIIDIDRETQPLGKDGKKLSAISEEDLKTEADVKASQTFWKGKAVAEGRKLLDYVFVMGTGFAICLVLVVIGILDIAPGG